MMLFKPVHVPLILDGTKTQTRRIWKRNRANIGSIHQARTELFGKPFAYLKIKDRYKERLGDISLEDIIKEGYQNRIDFMNIWKEINGCWNPNQEVDVIGFTIYSLGESKL